MTKGQEKRLFVRGYKICEFHADILSLFSLKECADIEDRNDFDVECLGGGRIAIDREMKQMQIYGFSQGYGRADHQTTLDIVKPFYPEYEITWSNEGY